MTREKKKVRSVAGQKFVPIKQAPKKTKDFDDPNSYESRKRKSLAKKKRKPTLYEKNQEAVKEGAADGKSKRTSRLKHDPAKVAEASRKLLETSETSDSNDSEQTGESE